MILLQYLQLFLLHALVSGSFCGSMGFGATWTSHGLNVLARMRVSLQFLGLLKPLTIRYSKRGLVELDLSRRSQFLDMILSRTLPLGWQVVMRKKFFSFSFSASATLYSNKSSLFNFQVFSKAVCIRIFWTNYGHLSSVKVLTFLECSYLMSNECLILIRMSCTNNEHSCNLQV